MADAIHWVDAVLFGPDGLPRHQRIHWVDAVLFGPDGLPRHQRVPIQNFAIGRGLEVPHLRNIFRTPADTNYLLVIMQRSGKKFVVHFPIQPRPGRHPPRCANVLVCRATGPFEGYVDFNVGDLQLARIAAGFALATCYNEDPRTRASDQVLVHEPLEN